MNAHDAVVDAILTALRAAPAVTAGPIDEEIDAESVAEQHAEAVSVALASSAPSSETVNGHPVTWRSEVSIECYARRDGRTVTGRASRALHARVYARLLVDPSLGGIALGLDTPRIDIVSEVADTRLGCCIGTYGVLHRTPAGSLSQA